MNRVARFWSDVWFTPASAMSFRAARFVVAAHALWIVLSRPDTVEIARWPVEFWNTVDVELMVRFGIGWLPVSVEYALYLVLAVALGCVLVDVWPRTSGVVAAVLLYHFGPFEELFIGLQATFFGGLTLPVLALFIFGFVEAPRPGAAPSADYRWTVTLVQLLFSFNYFVSALSKLHHSGFAWFTPETIRDYAVLHLSYTAPPLAGWLATDPLACWSVLLGTIALEFLFPLVIVSRWARRILVPTAALFHLGIVWTLHFGFPSMPLLLIYVNWEWLAGRLRLLRFARNGLRTAAPTA